MKDVLGNTFTLGDRVAVAFSYSQASVGYMRLGTVEFIDTANKRSEYDIKLKVRWEKDNKLSPLINYGSETRWLRL